MRVWAWTRVLGRTRRSMPYDCCNCKSCTSSCDYSDDRTLCVAFDFDDESNVQMLWETTKMTTTTTMVTIRCKSSSRQTGGARRRHG